MPDLDDRIRGGLAALAPEPVRANVIATVRARRAHDRRRTTVAAAGVTALLGIGVASVATRDGDRPTQILDTDGPSSTTSTTSIEVRQVLTVPDVRGVSLVEATLVLRDLGFAVDVVRESSDVVPEGIVVRTAPTAETLQPIGATITVYVSSGLPEAVVPQLIPLTTDAAIRAITDAGFVPEARPVDVPAGAASAGRVVAQHPAAGSTAKQGTTITMTYGRPTG